jgi:hypothetical protein
MFLFHNFISRFSNMNLTILHDGLLDNFTWWFTWQFHMMVFQYGFLLWTLLPLKVLVPWALGFFTYSSIKKHFNSIVGLEGNRSYNCQSLQLRNNGFWVWGGLATVNPFKTSLSQFWTMSTFHMAWALLTETMLMVFSYVLHNGSTL